ncbi:MAG: hypothetical protein IJT31_10505 [Oscillibacter sp.]|nr:hypothetical protein [Oscillibacter sp.]
MSDKTEKKVPEQEKKAPQELNLDDLDAVQGGSLRNVSYSSTSSISQNTRDKI